MSKKMKKFWSLMLVALVTLGAAACSEKDENVDTKQEATVSFYAEFADDTRATLDKDGDVWKTSFEEGDKLYVGTTGNDPFEFTHNGEKFVCNAEGVQNIIGTEVTINGYFGNSTTGKNAVQIAEKTVTFQSGMEVTLESQLSFFMFNYTGELTLTADEEIFKAADNTPATEITLTAEGETFVAFYPTGNNTTISYSIDEVTCKTTTINFAKAKVYNLGKLLKKSQTWAIAGKFQGWDVSANNVAPMYELGNNMFVAYNLKDLNNEGFKFVMDYGWNKAVGSNGTTTTDEWTNCGNQNLLTSTADAYDVYFDAEYLQYYIVAADSEAPAAITGTRTIYFKPGADWEKDGAYFEVWVWGNGFDAKWSRFVWVEGSGADAVYSTKIHASATGMKIIRKYADKLTCDWNGTADSGDVTVDANNNMYTLSTKSWSTK